MKKVIMNNFLFMYLALFTNLAVYGNDSILVNKIWTERQTIFVNEAQVDSILDDSVTGYYGIGCGYGRCEKIYFYSNHQFRKIDVEGDTLLGKWKLEGELLRIKYCKKYKGHKKNNKFIIKYREKDYPTIYMFKKKIFECLIYCNYNDNDD